MNMKSIFIKKFALSCALSVGLFLQYSQAQQTFPVNGVMDERDGHYAFTNATIYSSPTEKIEGGTLLIKKGKVVAVGKNVSVPKDAITIDLKGKFIYPSFIELHANYGMPEHKPIGNRSNGEQYISNKQGAYSWNEALRPEINAAELFKPDAKKADEARKAGFGLALTHQNDGIIRGTGSVVFLGEEKPQEMVLLPTASAHFSFGKGSSTQDYPSSLMGCIALLRQAYYDAIWYKNNPTERDFNISLQSMETLEKLPAFFEANRVLDILRADKVGDEFGVQYILKGGGEEYQRIDAIKNTKGELIIPINFPLAYDVTEPYNAQQVQLTQLKHWELAPANPSVLAKNGISFSITMNGNANAGEFWENLRKAYQFGLSEADLLKSLTTTPARILKIDKQVGTLSAGMYANFFISNTNILSDKAQIIHHWVKGKGYVIQNIQTVDLRGKHELTINGNSFFIEAKGDAGKPELFIKNASEQKDTTKQATKLSYEWENNSLSFAFVPQKDTSKKEQEQIRLSLKTQNDAWEGKAMLANGNWVNCNARRTEAAKADSFALVKKDSSVLGQVVYPFNPYGRTADKLPKAETVLFKNATVWTGETEGILEQTDVLVENGKIKQIGKNLPAGNAKVVDATGRHLTAGIIDEHSHICISFGVNEGTQASSAEVRIGDVVNSEDVNMYRQLAGGVVAAQLLHGSANPIGGQSALIKFRWGAIPEDIKIKEANGYIKFALGENVKQSNWGDYNTQRFPQTRMGVEQVYEDYFTRAKEYSAAMKSKGAAKVRRDLDLDALVEILEAKRFISCHSYVQSEITMLMRVAEKHGFRVNTFTHILEGFKVADKMKEHGVGASTFSDWWAYKYEVIDAVPQNAQIMTQMGITTAINSDDAEMGRRLNQEAAKSVKYGGMQPHDAWKMVTINPAKLLRIDNQTGSIKAGKSADVVLWSDNPLSIYARPLQTYVDGLRLFDTEEDKQMRANIQAERSRLIQKSLNAKANGAKTQPTLHTHEGHYHCGDDALNSMQFFPRH